MGQAPSSPRPGTPFHVIGAGLPRTGTSSLNLALSILFNAPCYHGGTQATLGPETEIKSLITLLRAYPPTSPSSRNLIHKILKERLDGYAAVTDSPCNGLVEELLQLYPDAKVICTVRDPQAWVSSMQTVANASTLSFLRFMLFLLPTMRFFPDYVDALRNQWVSLYGRPEPATLHHWEAHMAYLKRVVPKEKLVFFDVRDGWGPLCAALGREVPDVEFPRVNDGKAIDELARRMILRGLGRWAVVFGTVGAGVLGWWFARS
ncbi:Nn.00g028190.m01.CDS01 [Neocucurbitaria sp. VM-36]